MITREEIQRRVDGFTRWHYQFDLKGVSTPIWDSRCINRHIQRKRYFFEPLVALCGGSLRGKRVLDLGCNAGFWSLAAINAGCEFVCGLDGRQLHIDQANLVFEANDVRRDRYSFMQCDIFAAKMGELGIFDIVLCLGLLYHVSRPMELMEIIGVTDSDLLIIDTSLHSGDEPLFHLRHDDLSDPRNAVDSSLIFLPTLAAVIEITRHFGYHGLVLKPAFDDYTGAEDFRDGARRAFLCARRSDLSSVRNQAEASF